ncbi:hypothetical protein KAU11_11545 [Candidatus Babeliales bacterium]|nr:hypothetical protein [Candidatus Babeliales bacterium]
MATFIELMDLRDDNMLRNRVTVALTIKAVDMVDAANTPTAEQQKWASAVFTNPMQQGKVAFIAVLADNAALTRQAIIDVTDTQIQTSVDSLVDSLVVAFNAA